MRTADDRSPSGRPVRSRNVRAAAAAALLLIALVACAPPGEGRPAAGADDEAAAEFERRAAQVAAAWRDSPAADTWRTGLVLLAAPTVLPEGEHPEEVSHALHAGWLRTELDLPEQQPDDSEVSFANGEVMPVALISARQAWQEISRGEPDCPDPPAGAPEPTASPDPDAPVSSPLFCTVLTVVGVEQGSVARQTSRGEAQLPAWLFEVEGLAEPLALVAVVPAQISAPPRVEVDFPYQPGLAIAMGLVAVAGAQLTFQLGIGACDRTPSPLVFADADVVVVGGLTEPEPGVMACTDQLVIEEVSASLPDELRQRPVLATTGEVLAFDRW